MFTIANEQSFQGQTRLSHWLTTHASKAMRLNVAIQSHCREQQVPTHTYRHNVYDNNNNMKHNVGLPRVCQ